MSSASGAADQAVREAAPWIERLARLGYLAKALLYMTIGALAALAAFGKGGATGTDSRGAMAALFRQPFGRAVLAMSAVGLFGYALWRIVEGIKDPRGYGRTAKGLARRAWSVATGLVHLALAYSAVHFALGIGSGGGGGAGARRWTARGLTTPGGTIVLYAVGSAFIGYGLYQLYRAIRNRLGKRLALEQISWRARGWVVGTSRFGIVARGVVFGMIGVLLVRATYHRDASEAGGVRESMRALVELGRWPFAAIAFGLIAYGVYELLNARYRRIDVR